MSNDGTGADRRQAQRHRVLKSGRIIFRSGFSVIDCLVRDESETGARLKFDTILGIPDTFQLQIMKAPPRHVRVVWRRSGELGVEFM